MSDRFFSRVVRTVGGSLRRDSKVAVPLPSWHAAGWMTGETRPTSGRHREVPAGGTAERWRPDRPAVRRLVLLLRADEGMSTVEYAVGTIAAAGIGALLYTIVTGDSIRSALTALIRHALSVNL
ncbi:hypothetical protein FHR81_005427 [Actinoalloteichus hoggarensis]|uniref:Uncharacterized protein n=1 Tax=Actinoalloteichus hoggarensis TaxID=1470176 RepID=A0A221VWR3_9PSEU|nr:DUF4244 domain-containing protein [Actinoalloteichus hoggarensis]ASO17938.1 hypothetical protein AHOG_01360 [Actinoalloteichus hoggarensis]MBB5924350.1 hypothetical protein [Actinoalloteichus hoggarensis]